MIRELKPAKIVNSKIRPPQCSQLVEVPLRNNAWKKVGYKSEQCQREAGIAIGAACYCRQHAAQIALSRWLTGDLVENPAKEAKDGSSQSEEDREETWSSGHS